MYADFNYEKCDNVDYKQKYQGSKDHEEFKIVDDITATETGPNSIQLANWRLFKLRVAF